MNTDEIESQIDALNIAIKQMEDELAKVEELEKALCRLHDVEFHRERGHTKSESFCALFHHDVKSNHPSQASFFPAKGAAECSAKA